MGKPQKFPYIINIVDKPRKFCSSNILSYTIWVKMNAVDCSNRSSIFIYISHRQGWNQVKGIALDDTQTHWHRHDGLENGLVVTWFNVFNVFISRLLASYPINTLKPTISFLNNICNTCTEECVLAACLPNPMGLYYTLKESLWKKLSFGIKIFLVYRRTHFIWSDESSFLLV